MRLGVFEFSFLEVVLSLTLFRGSDIMVVVYGWRRVCFFVCEIKNM